MCNHVFRFNTYIFLSTVTYIFYAVVAPKKNPVKAGLYTSTLNFTFFLEKYDLLQPNKTEITKN